MLGDGEERQGKAKARRGYVSNGGDESSIGCNGKESDVGNGNVCLRSEQWHCGVSSGCARLGAALHGTATAMSRNDKRGHR